MINRFLKWWNKENEGEISAPKELLDEAQSMIEEEEEFIYETTLKRDLKSIVQILSPEVPWKNKRVEVYDRDFYSSVKFKVYSREDNKIFKRLQSTHVSLHMTNGWDNIEEYWWEMNPKEFAKKYKSPHKRYGKHVSEILKIVEENYENELFWHIFMKYEDSILFALNTLNLSIEHLGKVDGDVLSEVSVIIQKLSSALYKRNKEIEELEELELQAVKEGLINSIKDEVKLVEEYVEYSIEDHIKGETVNED